MVTFLLRSGLKSFSTQSSNFAGCLAEEAKQPLVNFRMTSQLWKS